jgi:hypothetical protein
MLHVTDFLFIYYRLTQKNFFGFMEVFSAKFSVNSFFNLFNYNVLLFKWFKLRQILNKKIIEKPMLY